MAPWQSGYAADCKSVDLGSIPGGASIIFPLNSNIFLPKSNPKLQFRPLTIQELQQN
ncbi:hypothetical protein THZG08_460030 [Vibrio owensii]|nr:hypothetical protein THZG08_460030 [Vibrio owensii]CAH1580457.1 hypothetical protein THOA03_460030 [Vibrio owensii]